MLVMIGGEAEQEGLMDERGQRAEIDDKENSVGLTSEAAAPRDEDAMPAYRVALPSPAPKDEPAVPDSTPAGPVERTVGEATRESAEATEGANMGSLMADMEADFRSPHRGDVVEGTVVRIDKDGVMVDIGTKSEGMIPNHELQGPPGRDEQLKVGDEVLVYVLSPENQEGHVVLSLRRARSERGWRTAQKEFEEGKTIEAEIVDYNRGGLIVDVDGVRGFVPMSQVVGLRQDTSAEADATPKMAGMLGKVVPLKILEINRRRNRLILSERSAVQELRGQRKEQLLAELQEGQIRHGRVSSLCDFGAFVDLGGADGLVHLSELSWSQVSHPSEILRVGDEVDVYVLGVDREKKKIALSLRRSQAEPWSKIADKYNVGDMVTGKITKLAQFGAFARIEDGIEGLIHISELSEGHVQHPKNVVKEGDVLTLRVIRIDPTRRRLGLSLRQAEPGQEHSLPYSSEEATEQADTPSSDEAPVGQ